MTVLHLDPESVARNASGKAMPFAVLTLMRSGTTQALMSNTADASGNFSAITPDYLTYTYRAQLKDQYGVLRYDVDPYLPIEGTLGYIPAQVQLLDAAEIRPAMQLLFTSDAAQLLKVDIFADAACTVPRPNPITADSSGLFPPIYLQTPYYANGVNYTPAVTNYGREIFTTSGTWAVPDGVTEADVLVVGPGGDGSGGDQQEAAGGGGGGGQVRYFPALAVAGSIAVTVDAATLGTSTASTAFGAYSAIRGGDGKLLGIFGVGGNSDGACGGGGGVTRFYPSTLATYTPGVSTISGYGGQTGLIGPDPEYRLYGGGGGGAGAAASAAGVGVPSNGGAGVYYGDIFGTDVGDNGWFGGGGGGGVPRFYGEESSGGIGGGGRSAITDGVTYTDIPNSFGLPASGGGGGGSNVIGNSFGIYDKRGKGGSGVVIIRWVVP